MIFVIKGDIELLSREYFEYYNNHIKQDNNNVQENIARFVTGVINPTLDKFDEVEKVYFDLIKNSFDLSYEEKINILQNKDRYVPDDIRKADGEYFTPESLAHYGREIIKTYVDLNDFYIWDVSCGTGNLLRSEKDFDPEKVFMSTLNKSDVELIRDTGFYSDKVTVFDCDFLSDVDYDTVNSAFLQKLPEKLQQAIKNNEKILFYFNPPFKSPAPNTAVSRWMKEMGLGKATSDLYTQFIFKVVNMIYTHNLTNSIIGVFSPSSYLKDNTGLLTYIQKSMNFQEGIIFNSYEFADTTSSEFWGIVCAIYTHKELKTKKDGECLMRRVGVDDEKKVKEVSKVPLEIFQTKTKRISEWAKSTELDYFVNSNAYHFFDKVPTKEVKASINGFAYVSYGDELKRNGTVVFSSKPIAFQSFLDVTTENYLRSVVLFGAYRSCTDRNDFFMNISTVIEPESQLDDDLLRDLIVYSLVDLKSQQFASRIYNGNSEDVRNRMFFIDEEILLDRAKKEGCTSIIKDYETNSHKNMFYHKILKPAIEKGLSPEAKEIITYNTNYLLDTLKLRSKAPANYQLSCWDAGWVQVRYLLKHIKDNQIEKGYYERLIAFKKIILNKLLNVGVYSHMIEV